MRAIFDGHPPDGGPSAPLTFRDIVDIERATAAVYARPQYVMSRHDAAVYFGDDAAGMVEAGTLVFTERISLPDARQPWATRKRRRR